MVPWTAPASNGGSADRLGYVVTPYVDGVAQPTHTFDAPNTTRAVTGLANGTTYTFRVAARNDIGLGLNSAASNPATPATLPGPPTLTGSSPSPGPSRSRSTRRSATEAVRSPATRRSV